VVGYLSSSSRLAAAKNEAAFRQGLSSLGFVEGRSVSIDYRYDENLHDQLPALAADLVRRKVDVIFAQNNLTALTVKAATTTIPIIFSIGGDPIQLGLVTSLNRPGDNLTGTTFLQTTTVAIRLQMLHEAVPRATIMGMMLNPTNPNSEPEIREAQDAARKLGLQLHVASARNANEIDMAFAALIEQRMQGLVIVGDPLFTERRQQVAALTLRHGVPAISSTPPITEAGLLMSYGGSNLEAYRLAGAYVGRILKGDKPADLPVQQATKVELIVNLITAKVLGITFPLTLLGRADEVIE
jgi:putative ABC transport system substrate-binding protein